MPVVEPAQQPLEGPRPRLPGIRPVLGRAEGVVGDEDLRPVAAPGRPDLVGGQALVGLPAVAGQARGRHPGDGRLAHLRRSAEDHEPVPAQRVERPGIRAHRHEDLREVAGQHTGMGEPQLRMTINRFVRRATVGLAADYGDGIVRLVSETVRGWDTGTVTRRLENAVGRDLQYIRVNGTLVGGLVGLVIHTIDVML